MDHAVSLKATWRQAVVSGVDASAVPSLYFQFELSAGKVAARSDPQRRIASRMAGRRKPGLNMALTYPRSVHMQSFSVLNTWRDYLSVGAASVASCTTKYLPL